MGSTVRGKGREGKGRKGAAGGRKGTWRDRDRNRVEGDALCLVALKQAAQAAGAAVPGVPRGCPEKGVAGKKRPAAQISIGSVSCDHLL